jgi:hypothetical protein
MGGLCIDKACGRLIVILLHLLCSNYCAAEMKNDDKMLHDFFTAESHSTESLVSARQEMPRVCLEVGMGALPVLSQAVSRQTPSNVQVAEIAFNCLVRIGGPDVRELLRKMYREATDQSFKDVMKAALCNSMQSTGSPSDIEFLIDSLEGPIFGLKALAPSAAAYALAVLKPQSARAALERRVQEYKNTPLEEVKLALERIDGRQWITPQADSARGKDILILKVFQFGIPHISMSDVFVEPRAKRVWVRDANTWQHRPSDLKYESLPSISFDVFVTEDEKRAICSVTIVCGNACAYGYDFILGYEELGWRVVGLFPTWIS